MSSQQNISKTQLLNMILLPKLKESKMQNRLFGGVLMNPGSYPFVNCKWSELMLAVVMVFFITAAMSQTYGNIISDGGFESIYDYPTMYAHENARIKIVVDAGWDVGGKDNYRFPAQWTADAAPAGHLRVSEDAHSGRSALEFGKGGVVYCTHYITPTGVVGKYPFREGRSCTIRVWAKGTGKLIARIREYDAGGARPEDAAVGVPEMLSADWREYIFLYTPKVTAPDSIQLAFTADGLAKVDDVSMLDVVEFNHLVAALSEDVKTAQADAKDNLVPMPAVEAIADEVNGILQKTKEAMLTLPGQLALREEISPVAQRLKAIVWQGRGKRAGRISLTSERLNVEFYGKALQFRLAAITDPEKEVDFLSPFGSEVWRIKLVNPAWKSGQDTSVQPPAQLYLTSDSKCASLKNDISADGRKLTLNWLGFEIPGTAKKLDVSVSVSLPKGARLSRWHIKVSGGAKNIAISEVHFPMLATLTPMTAQGRGDYLVLPDTSGRLIKNPYQGESYGPCMTLQMWALYSEKAGLYCAAEDGEWYKKQFDFAAVPNEKMLHAQITNFPENNMTGGNAYDMPYETVMGTFDGTWWDASKIYRKWAIEQKWCKAFGPLYSSKATPQWYKDLPIWTLMYETNLVNKDAVEEDVLSGTVTAAAAEGYKKLYDGVPVAFHYYGWEKGHKGYGQGGYFPPGFGIKGWPMFIKQIHELGIRIVPYVQGSLFNTKFDWYTKEGGYKGTIYFPGGAPYIYDEKAGGGYANMTWMCQQSSQWQDKHVEIAKMLATCGVDGVYYDSFPGWYACYNPAHGHALGGGNYLTQGNRRLIARTREAAKAINPEMIFVSESPHETIVGALDGCLQFRHATFPDNIPLFSSVYHDFILLWGNTYDANYENIEQWAFIPIAYSFIRGDQLGWFGQGWLNAIEYTTYLAKLRMGPAQKFVTYGEMMEPPRFLNNLPSVTTPPWFKNSEKEPRTFAAVLHSAWKAPDGTLGMVFANIADKEQEVEYEFDATRYGLPVGKKYVVTEMVSKNIVGTYASPVFKRKDKVLPRQVLILEISAGVTKETN